jgi:hypothetical protein
MSDEPVSGMRSDMINAPHFAAMQKLYHDKMQGVLQIIQACRAIDGHMLMRPSLGCKSRLHA